MTWLPGDTGSSSLTGYQVLAEPGDIATTVGADASQATVTGLTDGTAYTFVVAATNVVGVGAPSVVTAPVIPDASLGGVPPALSDAAAGPQLHEQLHGAEQPGAQHGLEADASRAGRARWPRDITVTPAAGCRCTSSSST